MIAVLILAHHSPDLLGRLVKRLESYGAQCFIHIDAKVDIAPFRAACSASSPIFVKPRKRVTWGGFSLVAATLSLLSAAISDTRFTHFVLISGDSYPIKPREQFRQLVMRPFEQLEHRVIPSTSPMYKRITETYFPETFVHFAPDEAGNSAAQPRVSKTTLMQVKRIHKMKQQGFPWRYAKGGQWWSLTAETARHCMDVIGREPELMKWFAYSAVPDEALFQTILENFGLFRIGAGMPVYTVWDGTAHPLEFSDPDHFEKLKRAANPFARKFSLKNGAQLLDLLDHWMDT